MSCPNIHLLSHPLSISWQALSPDTASFILSLVATTCSNFTCQPLQGMIKVCSREQVRICKGTVTFVSSFSLPFIMTLSSNEAITLHNSMVILVFRLWSSEHTMLQNCFISLPVTQEVHDAFSAVGVMCWSVVEEVCFSVTSECLLGLESIRGPSERHVQTDVITSFIDHSPGYHHLVPQNGL